MARATPARARAALAASLALAGWRWAPARTRAAREPRGLLADGLRGGRHLLHLSLTGDQRLRVFAPLDEIPASVIDATLLQEDRTSSGIRA